MQYEQKKSQIWNWSKVKSEYVSHQMGRGKRKSKQANKERKIDSWQTNTAFKEKV